MKTLLFPALITVDADNNTANDSNAPLQFSSIDINADYCEKWHIRSDDFICLTRNGKLLRNTLYRVGGLGMPDLNTCEYFMLIKHVEAFYAKDIMKMSKDKDPRHLEGRWCILDKYGNEKVEFEQFQSPYLINDSCIYSIDGNYYNVETNKLYCHTYHSISSKHFLFIENKFDEDITKRGVLKINKRDGSMELFS